MFTYKQFILIQESKKDSAVICFGRFQGITAGHLKLFNKIVSVAKQKDALPMVFTSHTNDKKKNPLNYNQKLELLKSCMPNGVEVVNSEAKTLYNVLEELGKLGFKNISIVCGSDRIKDFERTNQYKEQYGLNNIEIISSGERDADSDNVSGASGTKLRQLAVDNDFEGFAKMSALDRNNSKKMFDYIRNVLVKK